uniref:NADH dehydrogenase [ubiquinone] iron-sulfur protein 6, mitochondrial isoform X2 n=1 Tax=Jaculus jaculus TaxID=51337 RepID=UPI001E1B0366|nr:NADH dehydrogenase [ubiquinone] iron-sulfur protein 6, mitochondrial isoform X2 [Jaculus jaculus]
MAAAAVTFRRLLFVLPRAGRHFGVRVSPTREKVTHTGQVYDDKDYRKIRFVGRQKEVSDGSRREERTHRTYTGHLLLPLQLSQLVIHYHWGTDKQLDPGENPRQQHGVRTR